jgi:hypothetical protein
MSGQFVNDCFSTGPAISDDGLTDIHRQIFLRSAIRVVTNSLALYPAASLVGCHICQAHTFRGGATGSAIIEGILTNAESGDIASAKLHIWGGQ